MSNRKYQVEHRLVAGLTGNGEFRALASVSGKHPDQALLRALTGLFIQNTAPTLWEIGQFQELMLNFLPVVDSATRQELMVLLAEHPHTPEKVRTALASEFVVKSRQMKMPLIHDPAQISRRQQRYTLKQLRDILPLQVSGKIARVAALAAMRDDRNTLRTVLATHLTVSRPFAEHLLSEPDGFALATALRALRMPDQVARTILLACQAMHSSRLTGLPQPFESFKRLDPEACRKRIMDWEQAFLTKRRPQMTRSRTGHQPLYVPSGQDRSRPADTIYTVDAASSAKRKAG
uniref:hypothetical protein n=1 Tax=Pararhizobium sp. IMCC3301 TaxID=3067904 RepID=UPI002742835C|nr:hypothetical protein [Pararhizobium sp. IMCC3301]